MSYAEGKLQTILAVQPIVGNLFVPRNCSATWIQGEYAGTCSLASPINMCGEVQQIPPEHLDSLEVVSQYGRQQSYPAGVGVPETDLLVYVTSTEGLCDSSTLAYASPCHLDQGDRPIVGSINFCPGVVAPTTDALQLASDQAVALHEMIHLVGFSMTLFSYFRDEAGTPRTQRCPDAPGCSEDDRPGDPPYNPETDSFFLDNSTVAAAERRGRAVRYLATPSVRGVARSYFGCAALPGAELEGSGNAEATVGSHWEKRVLFTELMTGSTSAAFPEVLSEFTLALLDDSGWYQVTAPGPRAGSGGGDGGGRAGGGDQRPAGRPSAGPGEARPGAAPRGEGRREAEGGCGLVSLRRGGGGRGLEAGKGCACVGGERA